MNEHISTYIQDHIPDLLIYQTSRETWRWNFKQESSVADFTSYEQCLTSFILCLISQSSAVSKKKK